ncbi:MAG: hypothetical protein WD046_12595 [Paracoccaceae bacterium]
MLKYHVSARRIDSHGSEATTKDARIVLDTDMAGRAGAFNPAEMLLASLGACILKGTERVIPMLQFELHGIEVSPPSGQPAEDGPYRLRNHRGHR